MAPIHAAAIPLLSRASLTAISCHRWSVDVCHIVLVIRSNVQPPVREQNRTVRRGTAQHREVIDPATVYIQ